MYVSLSLWILSPLLLKGVAVVAVKTVCDPSLSVVKAEGPMGETSVFPWLGVLKVNIHEENSLQMAMTGLVMVKEGYAIANADDIVRIPKKIFLRDSLAMFIPREGEAWYCLVQDYMTHPEYAEGVINTIALLELTLVNDPIFPVKPVCHPSYPFNTSSELYAVGFTDEGKLLEKFIHKMVYVTNPLCEEYYKRAGFTNSKKIPERFHCGFTLSANKSCIWDNGMALISNATTGEWRMVGFGLHGPGCAAPARFIDLQQYYSWINAMTNPHDERAALRQSALNLGFKPRGSDKEDIPIHDLLQHGLTHFKEYWEPHDDIIPGPMEFSHYYPFETIPFGKYPHGPGLPGDGHGEGGLEADTESGIDHFTIHRQEPAILYVSNDDYSYPWGNCSIRNNFLIYKDYMKIETMPIGSSSYAAKTRGTAVYKLSMFDLYYLNYTCVKIKLYAARPENAYISYDVRLENSRRQAIKPQSKTNPHESYKESQFPNPPDIIKVYPIRPPGGWGATSASKGNKTENGTNGEGVKETLLNSKIVPKPHWKVQTISDDITSYEHPTINIYLKLHFVDQGKLEVRVFGPPRFSFTAPTTNPARRSITWNAAKMNKDKLKSAQDLHFVNLKTDQLVVDVNGYRRRSRNFLVGILFLNLMIVV